MSFIQLISHFAKPVVATVVALASAGLHAQDAAYPNKPIRVIVPVPAGAAADIAIRRVAESMGASLGQPLVMDNRPGAGGGLGTIAGAKSPADGYTLVVTTMNTMAFNPSLYKNAGYDPLKDLVGISRIITVPNVLVVSRALGVTTMPELVALARKRAAENKPLLYASGGNGTSPHISGAQWRSEVKTEMSHVPYKGGPASVIDLVAGRVDFTFANIQLVVPHINAGTLVPIALTSAKRSPQLPNVPTVAEVGMPALEMSTWIGLAVPAGTPAPIIEKLHAAVVKAARSPEVKAAQEKDGNVVETDASSAEFQKTIAEDIRKWSGVIKSAGITVE
ncbi:MAG: tripartite tricarboxylate transporter substrate binding protein [Pseudomonadota bacterium]